MNGDSRKQEYAGGKGAARRVRRRGAVSELVFLLAGIALTMAAFIFTGIFVDRLVKNEHELISRKTANDIAAKFEDLERAADLLSDFPQSAPHDSALARRLAQSVSGMAALDRISILTFNGEWSAQDLFARNQNSVSLNAYAIRLDKNFLPLMDKSARRSLAVIADPDYFLAGGTDAPFALIRALPVSQASERRFLVLAGKMRSVLSGWGSKQEMAAEVVIRDPEAGENLLRIGGGANGESVAAYPGSSYEFSFGDKIWEIEASPLAQDRIRLLQAFPLVILVFGFLLTAVCALYIHSARAHSIRASKINRALRRKNRELQQEASKRARLHEIFRKTERENQSLIDSVSDIIFEADAQGKILFLNATWKKITGFESDQSRGKDVFSMLHPQEQEKQRANFASFVQGKKQPYRCFARIRTSDGLYRAVEMSISMMRQDASGNARAVGTFTDVEERRRAEKALSETEKKYRAIVENAAGGIFQLTPEGIYLSANPALARILGYASVEELLGSVKNANETVYLNYRERQHFIKEMETSGFVSNYETQVIRKDGSRIWVNENARLVKDERGAPLYYEGSIEDIQKRKETEMALKEAKIQSDLASRAKSEFISNMSHELRTPLNSIIGFSEILKNEIFGPLGKGQYKEYAHDIYESGKRLLSVINEILDISRIEAGERHLNEQIVDIYAVSEECLKLFHGKIRAGNLTLHNMLKDVPKVVGEEAAIKQIFVNLISNAIKFTPGGGRVIIKNETDAGGGLRVSITDTGVGLEEDEIAKVLSPFGQTDGAFKKSNAGAGLGLTLVDALIKLHEGNLEIVSQKGIGTTVTVVFPANRVQKKQTAFKDKTIAREQENQA